MNPGTLTSPVRGDVLEQAVALRALGMQWDQIAAELRKRTGIGRITGPMVGAVVRRTTKTGVKIRADERHVPFMPPQVPSVAGLMGASLRKSAAYGGPASIGETDHDPYRDAGPPAVHTSRTRAEGYLVVPDLQAPFHEPNALEFCERVRREFGIPKDNVLFTGDEIDNFHGKGLDKRKDPDADHTPRQELAAAVDELKRWYSVYPTARLAVSNHGTRYERRAAEAEISSQWLRLYREVIEAPPGWQWQARWMIQASKHPFILEHGHEGSSKTEAKVLENGYSTVHGHFTKAQIVYVSNHLGRRLWGFCAAALIDYDTYAFAYAKKYPRRADNGVGVILDGGTIPLWVPFMEAA